MNYDYAYIGDFRNGTLLTVYCPSCGGDKDLDYDNDLEQWACHYCEEMWLGPPPPSPKREKSALVGWADEQLDRVYDDPEIKIKE